MSDKQCIMKLNKEYSKYGRDDDEFYEDISGKNSYSWIIRRDNEDIHMKIDRATGEVDVTSA